MYNEDRVTVKDRREQLRVKVKSLAAEAKIIRREEQRTNGVLREELYDHRVRVVRSEARAAHLAYGFIRGRSYESMEQKARTCPPWTTVQRLCTKYGPAGFKIPGVQPSTQTSSTLQKAA